MLRSTRIAILDPAAGISGDMVLGALVDAGVEGEWLETLPGRLGLKGVQVAIERVARCGVAATKARFLMSELVTASHGRHVGELIEVVERAALSPSVRERAARAFRLIGEAEGRVHGVAPERVHLHEVGAVDAMLDVVGGVEGFERLGVSGIYNLPVALGDGWVEATHGQLPVPAPATMHLLEGLEVRTGGPVRGEATTPTGAALLRVLSQGSPPVSWRLVSSHWGAGDRDPAQYPNALRLILAEGAPEAGTVEVIATDLDDLAPEYLEALREAVVAAGALDCVMWPGQGKKGRVSVRVEALVTPDVAHRVVEALFAHSTTAGVRRWSAMRSTLRRRELDVELDTGVQVRVKVLEGRFGLRVKAEYADVVAAASRLGRPALEIAREAERRAEARLREGSTNKE